MTSLNPKNAKLVWHLTFEGDWPTSVAFLGSSRRLTAGNREGRIFIWDLPESAPEQPAEEDGNNRRREAPNLDPVRRLDGHTNGITRLISTSDGKTLISASLDHTIRLWNPDRPAEGTAQAVMDMNYRRTQARRKSPEEQKKIFEAPGIEVEVQTTHELLAGHADWVQALGLSADEKRLISGDDHCDSIVWDFPARKEVSRWHGYDRIWVTAAALSPDGKTAFTAEYAWRRDDFDRPAAQVRLWNADDGSLKLDLMKLWTPKVKDDQRVDSYGYAQAWGKFVKGGLVCAAFSPDGKLIAAGQGGETDNGQILLIDAESGEILRNVSGHQYGVCDVQFSADGQYLISGGRDTVIKICQVSDGKEVAAMGKARGGQFKDWIHAVSLSADQQWLAAADIGGLVQVWRFE